jgi:hypothetical protein
MPEARKLLLASPGRRSFPEFFVSRVIAQGKNLDQVVIVMNILAERCGVVVNIRETCAFRRQYYEARRPALERLVNSEAVGLTSER